MARASLSALLTQVRLPIGDPAGASAVFSDDELQLFLDNHATDVFYAPLTPEPSIAAGGVTSYLTWRADVQWWEAVETLTDSDYAALTAVTSDRQRGRWTFAASQNAVMVTGTWFDVYLAAADAVDAWLAKVKLSYDFSADGGDFKRSQLVKSLQELATRLRSQGGGGGVITATMYRGDVNL